MRVFEAEHVELSVNEQVQILCPAKVTERYHRLAQIVTLATIGPLAMVLFTCVFHIPVLPLIGLVMLLFLVRRLEDPMTRLTVRVLWPAHRLYLAYADPGDLVPQTIRQVRLKRSPALLSANPDSGSLNLDGTEWDLSSAHHIDIERADDQGPQIRLRLFQPGRVPVVVGAEMPIQTQAALDLDYRSLPRKEGEVLLMPWEQFKHFVGILRQFNAANEQRFPPLLERIV